MKTHYYVVLNHEDGTLKLDVATPQKMKLFAIESSEYRKGMTEDDLTNTWCDGYQFGTLSFMEIEPESSLFQSTLKQFVKDLKKSVKQ